MNASRYKVIFTGKITEGHQLEDVKSRIGLLFNLGEEKIERLFPGHPVLLRKNVDCKTAKRYQNVFEKAGAICIIAPLDKESTQIAPQHADSRISPAEAGFVPPEIRKWNWGAFLLNWIWGLGNKVYISLLCFVPFIGWIIPFLLAWKGNEWAWKNRHWDSVEQFKKVQKKWAIGGLAVCLVVFLISIFAVSRMGSRLASYQQLLEAGGYSTNDSCALNRQKIQTALNLAYQNGQMRTDESNSSALETLVQLGYFSELPRCSSGGSYIVKNGIVHCSVHGP
jgi:hypothetical protein